MTSRLVHRAVVAAAAAGALPRDLERLTLRFAPLGSDVLDGACDLAIAVAGEGALPSTRPLVLVASSPLAAALARVQVQPSYAGAETAWVRAATWSTDRPETEAGPPMTPERLWALGAADDAVRAMVAMTATAFPFVFARKAKPRLERVADFFVSASATDRERVDPHALVRAALAAIGPEPRAVRDVLREARAVTRATTTDAETLARALYERFEREEVELFAVDPRDVRWTLLTSP